LHELKRNRSRSNTVLIVFGSWGNRFESQFIG